MNRDTAIEIAAIIIPTFVLWMQYLKGKKKKERQNTAQLKINEQEGLTEPPSLHPVIDPALCLGSGACVTACPEGDVLGLIDGKAQLINPTHCIGHGACLPACPFEAITLVFGTEKRGVDIPQMNANFETNVPGIFIAGELGGMGLIYNATEQGRQAMDGIAEFLKAAPKSKTPKERKPFDVLIVGAGPAGFSASLSALEKGLSYKTIEQESLGGRVAHYPRGKIVMTRPAVLPMHGKLKIRETTKEALLAAWQEIEAKTGVQISGDERMTAIKKTAHGFEVETSRGVYESRAVLLAIGRGGTPRKLGVPGERLSKVVYRLSDPEQYRGQKVFVVGGGDTALEAAIALSKEPGTEVSLSYRAAAFSRAKTKNREDLQSLQEAQKLRVYLESQVQEIASEWVSLRCGDKTVKCENDAVIICAGGILPTDLLKNLGIAVETHFGTA